MVKIKMLKNILLILIISLFCTSVFAITAEVNSSKEYDGIWFMGFNYHKDIFDGESGKKIRQAINYGIDKKKISEGIIGDKNVPIGVIPPGMLGYNPELIGCPYNPKKAINLIKQAGYSKNDKRLGNIILLHTDGKKTLEIVKLIKKDLKNIGLNVSLKEVSYKNVFGWNEELEAGRYHLYVMGYKTNSPEIVYIGDKTLKNFHILGCPNTPEPENQVIFGRYDEAIIANFKACELCSPKREKEPKTEDLLNALFSTQGEANIGYYRNPRINFLLEQLITISSSLKKQRADKLKEIDKLLVDDAASVNLFYITKL